MKPKKISKVSKGKGGDEPDPSDPTDPDCPGGEAKTFARRYRPKGGIAGCKWDALKNVFNRYIRPCVHFASAHEDWVAYNMFVLFQLLLCHVYTLSHM